MSCRSCSRQPSKPTQQPAPVGSSRRGVLAAAGGAALALLAWPRALLGGGKSWVAVPLSKAPKLQKVGGSMQTRIRGKELLLVRDGQDTAHAVEAKCPHEFCDINYVPESKKLECPCHDAFFDLSGKVLQGPPPRALETYPTIVDGDRILIRIPE